MHYLELESNEILSFHIQIHKYIHGNTTLNLNVILYVSKYIKNIRYILQVGAVKCRIQVKLLLSDPYQISKGDSLLTWPYLILTSLSVHWNLSNGNRHDVYTYDIHCYFSVYTLKYQVSSVANLTFHTILWLSYHIFT